MLPCNWLLVPIAWIGPSCEKCTIDQQCLDFLSLDIYKCTWNKHNKTKIYLWDFYHSPFFYLIHHGCELELRLTMLMSELEFRLCHFKVNLNMWISLWVQVHIVKLFSPFLGFKKKGKSYVVSIYHENLMINLCLDLRSVSSLSVR
jgi:hypothetical protein